MIGPMEVNNANDKNLWASLMDLHTLLRIDHRNLELLNHLPHLAKAHLGCTPKGSHDNTRNSTKGSEKVLGRVLGNSS